MNLYKSKSLTFLLAVLVLTMGVWMFFFMTRNVPQNVEQVRQQSSQTQELLEKSQMEKANSSSRENKGAEFKETQGQKKIYGSVVDSQSRQAIERAEVLLLSLEANSEGAQELTFSDASGSFELWTEKSGWFQILARKEKRISIQSQAKVQQIFLGNDTEALGPLSLELFQGAGFRIQVFSKETGDPLPFPEAKAHLNPKMAFSGNSKGEIAVVATPEVWSFTVSAPLHKEQTVSVNLGNPQVAAMNVYLDSALAVYGVVSEVAKGPVAGAEIRVRWDLIEKSVLSDSAGNYRLDHLPLGEAIFLRADHEDETVVEKSIFSDKPLEIRRDIEFGTGSSRAKRKDRVGLVEGWVFDESGQPVENALVSARNIEDQIVEEVLGTDKEGFFSLLAPIQIPMGNAHVVVEKTGFSSKRVSVPLSESAPAQVRILLSENRFLEGYVRDEAGEPIPSAKIQVFQGVDPNNYWWGHSETFSDELGFFRLEQLSPGMTFRVTGQGFSEKQFEGVALNRKDAEFILERLASLFVKLVHKDSDEPFQEPFLLFVHDQNQISLSASPELRAIAAGVHFQSAQGEAWVKGLRPKSRVKISIDSEEFSLEEPVSHIVQSSTDSDGQPLLLEVVKKTGVVAGVVITSDGVVLPNVQVSLLGVAAFSSHSESRSLLESYPEQVILNQTVASDNEGKFRFEKVPEGLNLELHGEKDGFANQWQGLPNSLKTIEKESLSMTMMRAGKLLVEVRVNSETLNDVIILSGSSLGKQFWPLNRFENEIVMNHLNPGAYELQLIVFSKDDPSPKKIQTKQVDLLEGEEKKVVFEDDQGSTVSGQVWVGNEVGAFREILLLPGEERTTSVIFSEMMPKGQTDGQGFFSLEDVMPGNYVVKLIPRHPFRRSLLFGAKLTGVNEIPLVVSGNVHEVFYFEKHSQITGRLVNAETVTRIWLEATNSKVVDPQIVGALNPNQSFSILDVPPGTYRLHASRGEGSEAIILLVEVVVPANGDDLNLGEIDAAAKGFVKIHLRPPPEGIGIKALSFMIYPAEMPLSEAIAGGGRQFYWENLSVPYKISEVPEGAYLFTGLGVNEGWIFTPLVQQIMVKAGKIADHYVSPVKTTLLTVELPDAMRRVSAKMQNLASGEVLNFIPVEGNPQWVYSGSEQFSIQSGSVLQARGCQLGPWLLQIESPQGGVITREFQLQFGVPMLIPIGLEKQVARGK